MLSEFKDQINPEVGTITFTMSNHNLFDGIDSIITIDRFSVGDSEFLIQKEPNLTLIFQHKNPKTGTRISRLDLNKVGTAKTHRIVFTWGDNDVNLYFGIDGQEPVKGEYQKLE